MFLLSVIFCRLFPFQLEEKLLQFHLGNLEFSCAAPLSKVSSSSWDQNEEFPQFSGDHTLLLHGFGVLLGNLAQGLDIRRKYEVRIVSLNPLNPKI